MKPPERVGTGTVNVVKMLCNKLRSVFQQLDAETARAITHAPYQPSCKAGCAHCCYVLTSISVPEGLLLATALLARPDWRGLIPGLVLAAKADCAPRVNNRRRFDAGGAAGVPCGFLDLTTRTCRVYADRPGACRFHYAVTPAQNCSRDAPQYDRNNPAHQTGLDANGNILDPLNIAHTTRFATLNLTEIEAALWEVTAQLAKFVVQTDVILPNGEPLPPGAITAPISLMTLSCALAITEPGSPEHKFLRPIVETLPEPETWMIEHVQDLHDEAHAHANEEPTQKEKHNALVQIGARLYR